MRKTALLLLVLVVSLSAYATPTLQLGGTVFYERMVSDEAWVDELSDLDNFGFGVEARLNILDWASLALPVTIGFGDDLVSLGTMPSLNLNLPVADFLDIAIGLGTRLTFSCHDDTWLVNGSSIDGFGDVFMNANLFYRAAATFNIGFFGIGLAASIPTEGSFRHFDAMPSWKETTISASVLVNFF